MPTIVDKGKQILTTGGERINMGWGFVERDLVTFFRHWYVF